MDKIKGSSKDSFESTESELIIEIGNCLNDSQVTSRQVSVLIKRMHSKLGVYRESGQFEDHLLLSSMYLSVVIKYSLLTQVLSAFHRISSEHRRRDRPLVQQVQQPPDLADCKEQPHNGPFPPRQTQTSLQVRHGTGRRARGGSLQQRDDCSASGE